MHEDLQSGPPAMRASPFPAELPSAGGASVRRLFDPDELGWLRNEARVLRLRLAALAAEASGPVATVSRPERWEAGFAHLALHPRLIRGIEERLGGSVALAGSWLWFGRPPGSPADLPGHGVLVAVNLGEPADRVGETIVAAGADSLAAALCVDALWFAAAYVPAAGSGLAAACPVHDEALWPPAIVCAA